MKRTYVFAAFICCTLALQGCASVALLGSTHEQELQKLYAGEPRTDVLARLGSPKVSRPLANGWTEDVHELRLRDDDAAMFAVVDVLTLGTLSMGEGLAGRPRDPIYRISATYNRDQRLVCARATRVSRENLLFKRLLPHDGVITGSCPA